MLKKNRITILFLLVFALEVTVSSSIEARRTREDNLLGLNLFFNVSDGQQANMRLLSKERNIIDMPREPYFPGTPEETQTMFNIIHNPLTDREAILQRQQVVRDLINQLDLGEANSLRSASYGYLKVLEFLLFGSDNGPYSYEKTKGLRELFEGDSNPTTSEIESLIDEVTERVKKHEEEHRWDNKSIRLSKEEELYIYLRGLREYGTEISGFINLLAGVSNLDVEFFSQDLALASEGLRDLTWQELLDFVRARDFEQISELKDQMNNLKNKLIKIGAILAFTQYAKNNDFSSSTYDSDSLIGYRDGRNFTRRLNEDEIPNSSTADVPCIVLTGSNMSGKSHNLVTDLFIQLLGQSFGWVPAKDPNIRIYENIIYIDRADTESDRNLSAFGSEIKDKWSVLVNLARSSAGPTIAFVDEGYSTTSPDDQFLLLGASNKTLVDYCDVRFKIATHNEDYIQYFQDDPDFRFYHFEIIIPESKDEEVVFTRRLLEGVGDSQAIAIARNQNMPEGILASAERYLSDNIDPLSEEDIQTPKPIEVVAYSDRERASLMQESGSFLSLFPRKNELTVTTHKFSGEQMFEWRYPENSQEYHSDIQESPLFLRLSDDSDFSSWGGIMSVEYENIGLRVLEYVQDMILWGPISDSKELLERQHMFEILSQSDQLDDVLKRCMDLNRTAWSSANSEVLGVHLDDFNIFMLEGSLQELDESYAFHNEQEFIDRMNIFLAILNMNLELSGLTRDDVGISGDIAKIERLLEIDKEYTASMDELNEWRLQREERGEEISKEEFGQRYNEWKALLVELDREFAELIGGHVEEDENISGWTSIYNAEGKKLFFGVHDLSEIGRMFKPLYNKVLPQLKTLSVFDVELESLRGIFTDLKERLDNVEGVHFFLPTVDIFIKVFNNIVFGANAKEEFMSLLTSFDSVHLNRFANYLGDSFDVFSKGLESNSELWDKIKEWHVNLQEAQREFNEFPERLNDPDYVAQLCQQRIADIDATIERYRSLLQKYQQELEEAIASGDASEFSLELKQDFIDRYAEDIREQEELRAGFEVQDIELVREFFGERLRSKAEHAKFEFPRFYAENYHAFAGEVNKLYAIVMFAKMIRDFGFCKVDFSENPEVNIQNGWNLVKREDEQVKNDVNLNLEQMINIVSGSNMSGKTFYEKMLIWVLLSAQSTGFAPADSVTMPIFNGIVYLDRVNQKMDMNLSAYSNEVEFWKLFLDVLQRENVLVLGSLDELGSTTSPNYQSACSFAISEEALRTGNYTLIAHHNHDFISTFSSTYSDYVNVYHLLNIIEDGEVEFKYILEEGHQRSNAIEVARTLGFDEEILQLAEEIKREFYGEEEEEEGQSGD